MEVRNAECSRFQLNAPVQSSGCLMRGGRWLELGGWVVTIGSYGWFSQTEWDEKPAEVDEDDSLRGKKTVSPSALRHCATSATSHSTAVVQRIAGVSLAVPSAQSFGRYQNYISAPPPGPSVRDGRPTAALNASQPSPHPGTLTLSPGIPRSTVIPNGFSFTSWNHHHRHWHPWDPGHKSRKINPSLLSPTQNN
ncbi:hypothetical protein BD410DRAFT_843857 [Rickenella mellea]|uniref:Uncharacterized protein n=1 Tax=Rickenella mellea TaxID=50990 RepID=A0A4Y7PRF8_9AGAM|nr:hypothetical protein BD410DRAFT_843857 [Rickenella mellea]